jgi:inorganic phosphate transporter, PiT family
MTPVRCSLAGRMATAWASTLPAAGVVGAAASWLAARGTGGVIAVAVGGLVLAKAMYAASRQNPVTALNVNDVPISPPVRLAA